MELLSTCCISPGDNVELRAELALQGKLTIFLFHWVPWFGLVCCFVFCCWVLWFFLVVVIANAVVVQHLSP